MSKIITTNVAGNIQLGSDIVKLAKSYIALPSNGYLAGGFVLFAVCRLLKIDINRSTQ